MSARKPAKKTATKRAAEKQPAELADLRFPEDDFNDTLIPRLLAAKADLSKIQFVGPVVEYDIDQKKNIVLAFDPARDVEKLAAAMATMDDIALIVIDPIVSAVSGDSHNNGDVRRGLMPLVKLAEAKNAALLGITHYTKGTQGRDTLETAQTRATPSPAAGFPKNTRRSCSAWPQPPSQASARLALALARVLTGSPSTVRAGHTASPSWRNGRQPSSKMSQRSSKPP